tara:strand:- start:308 stop:1756 length:1449 start_codon:yes stop_codon:yes gene_type:complete
MGYFKKLGCLTEDILIVDLDGTVLKSDMLHESFWSALGRDWRVLFRSLLAFCRGRAALKGYLFQVSDVDLDLLPYDDDVITYVKKFRERGGRTALVTGTTQKFADKIAEKLDIFDEVHGSDLKNNLKGASKAEFLIDRFGNEGFVYIGDSKADLRPWAAAKKAVTVNASSSLRKDVEAMGKPYEHLETMSRSIKPYFKVLRFHQWVKNVLIFSPIIMAHCLDVVLVGKGVIAFIAFSFTASSGYVLNDLFDLAADRQHPRKKTRPIASGDARIHLSSLLALALLMFGLLLAASLSIEFFIIIIVYFLFTITYSMTLKRKIILDIFMLAGLYTMRIVAGGLASNIELSFWLIAFSTFFFFALAAMKRQAELIDLSGRDGESPEGRSYSINDLPLISIITICSGYLSVLVMAQYVNSPAVIKLYTLPEALWGVCGVLLYWLTHMAMTTHRGAMNDDPVLFAIKDWVSKFCFCAILGIGILAAVW